MRLHPTEVLGQRHLRTVITGKKNVIDGPWQVPDEHLRIKLPGKLHPGGLKVVPALFGIGMFIGSKKKEEKK